MYCIINKDNNLFFYKWNHGNAEFLQRFFRVGGEFDLCQNEVKK